MLDHTTCLNYQLSRNKRQIPIPTVYLIPYQLLFITSDSFVWTLKRSGSSSDSMKSTVKMSRHKLCSTHIASSITTEPVQPIKLRFCVSAEWMESAIQLSLIKDLEEISEVTHMTVRWYLDSITVENQKRLMLAGVDVLPDKELTMDMTEKSTQSMIESLFTSSLLIFRCNGLSWVRNRYSKTEIYHIIGTVRAKNIQKDLNMI